MSGERSDPFRLRVSGRNACFTRPEMKVERVSYDVMTPSAGRGILEAILWKPAMRWRVIQIDVLTPIRWESIRRNEVGVRMSSRSRGIYVEDERQQRAGLLLRDVAYVIHAYFETTSRAGPEDTITKFTEMFRRRAEKGQCFNTPYLGCREFSAEFQVLRRDDPAPEAIPETRELGWMLLDMDFSAGSPMPRFFRARLEDGRMPVPLLEETGVRA